jgi:hypothetical protein
VVYFVEDALQVYVYHIPISFVDIYLGLLHGLMCITLGAKPVAVRQEVGLKQRL